MISSSSVSFYNGFKKPNNVVPFRANQQSTRPSERPSRPESARLYGPIASRIDTLEGDLDMTTDKALLAKQIRKMNPEAARVLIQERLAGFSRKLKDMIYTDPMLGVPNRRAFDTDKIKKFLAICTGPNNLGYISFDIDNFGGYNNLYGHQSGDEALKVFVEAVQESLGKRNTLYRIGGEEFSALLPNKDLDEVGKIAERIRKKVQNLSKRRTKEGVIPAPFTVSIGYSSLPPILEGKQARELYSDMRCTGNKESGRQFREIFGGTFAKMQHDCDDALYISKLFKGRNSVTNSNELETNDLYKTVLGLGKNFAGIMRSSSQSVTEELVAALKRHHEN